ncbi:YfjL-like protein [Clostridium sp.]
MKKNKLFVTLAGVIIIASLFIAWVYVGINGLPWKIKQTGNISQEYLSKKYPDLKYKISKAYYNSKFGYYSCSVVTKGDLPITFEVMIRDKENIDDNYYEMKVNTEAKNMIVGLIKNSIPNIKNISVLEDAGADSVEGSYKKYTRFTPENAYPLKISIIWNGDKMSLDNFIDKTLNIREILESKNIAVCGLYIQDDTNKYVIDLNGGMVNGKMEGNYNLTKAEIIKNKTAYIMK